MKMTRRGFLSTGAAATATHYAGREVAAAAVTESSGFATANGHKLYYATLGRGMPVIFMHGGLGFDHQYFRPFVDPLADAAQVVYYDHLGHGKSDRPADFSEITLERLSSDCDALATALGFDKFVLVGHSYGGFIAFDFAFRFPEPACRAGIHVHRAGSHVRPAQSVGRNAERRLTHWPGFSRGRPPTRPTRSSVRIGSPWRRSTTMMPLLPRAFWTMSIAGPSTRRQGPIAGSRFSAATTLFRDCRNLKVPTAVQYGAGDIWRFGDNERIAKNIPGATLKYYANSGHWPFQEEQSAFIADMRRFVTSLPR